MKETDIKARDGSTLCIGDLIETVQGTKFEIISILGQPQLQDKDGYLWNLEPYMSPNIWVIGKVENPRFL